MPYLSIQEYPIFEHEGGQTPNVKMKTRIFTLSMFLSLALAVFPSCSHHHNAGNNNGTSGTGNSAAEAQAPSSLSGKQIVFDFCSAQKCDDDIKWSFANEGVKSYSAKQGRYGKTGASTAQFTYSPNPMSANASFYTYTLRFSSGSTGTATMEAEVRGGFESYRNIRFMLK